MIGKLFKNTFEFKLQQKIMLLKIMKEVFLGKPVEKKRFGIKWPEPMICSLIRHF